MSKPKPSAPQAIPASAPQAKAVPRRARWWLFGGIALVVVIAAAIGYVVLSAAKPAPAPFVAGQPSTYPLGSTSTCTTTQAPFIAAMGFSTHAGLDTRSQAVKGLRLIETDQQGNITRSYKHPSWSSAGYLGPPVTDKAGNIYVIPVPAINVLDNPPDKANIIYKVDAKTGVMAQMLALPAAAAVTPENPFGLLGLTYDCDTGSLYATSVFGSTRQHEAGRIFRIDLAQNRVAAQVEGIDAFGAVVYNGAHGKRLYFGRARTPDIASIALDDGGNFHGDPRPEVSLANLGFHGDERGRRLTIETDTTLLVRSIQFDYNLVAPTETRQTNFTYQYDDATDTWHLVSTVAVTN